MDRNVISPTSLNLQSVTNGIVLGDFTEISQDDLNGGLITHQDSLDETIKTSMPRLSVKRLVAARVAIAASELEAIGVRVADVPNSYGWGLVPET